jgi:hypothetical protein
MMVKFHDRIIDDLHDFKTKELDKAAKEDANENPYKEAKNLSDELDDIELGMQDIAMGKVVTAADMSRFCCSLL